MVGLLLVALETKARPAVVIRSSTYLAERPVRLVGIPTPKRPQPLAIMDHLLLDWQSAGLRAPSCFRSDVLTAHRSELTVVGHLGQHDWESVKTSIRAAFAM